MQKLGWNGVHSSVTMKVDADAGTVTNLGSGTYGFCAPPDTTSTTVSATFTETTITWGYNDVIENECSLNRLTGDFVHSWNDANYGWMDWKGHCTKATQQF